MEPSRSQSEAAGVIDLEPSHSRDDPRGPHRNKCDRVCPQGEHKLSKCKTQKIEQGVMLGQLLR